MKILNYKIISLLIISVFLFGYSFVYAETTPTPKILTSTDLRKIEGDKIAQLRSDDLSKIKISLLSDSIISTSQKTSIQSILDSNLGKLSTLKNKLDNEPDIKSVNADILNIYKLRIFGVIAPQVRLTYSSIVLTSTVEKYNDVSTKLNAIIKKQSKDTTKIVEEYNLLNEKLTDAKNQASSTYTLATSLKVEGYPGNKTQVTQGIGNLSKGVQDLRESSDLIKSIIASLKALE